MKTTVEISDAILAATRALANREGATIKAVIERGLRHELAKAERNSEFQLRRASFGGRGLKNDVPELKWDRLRDLA